MFLKQFVWVKQKIYISQTEDLYYINEEVAAAAAAATAASAAGKRLKIHSKFKSLQEDNKI